MNLLKISRALNKSRERGENLHGILRYCLYNLLFLLLMILRIKVLDEILRIGDTQHKQNPRITPKISVKERCERNSERERSLSLVPEMMINTRTIT